MRPLLTALAVAAVANSAAAEPTPSEPASPRAIGRAGVGLVSDDSGLALLSNPAGLARRGDSRLSVGLRLGEIDTELISDSGRRALDQSGPTMVPSLAYARGLGQRWIIGVATTETSDFDRGYPAPLFGQPPDAVGELFFYRYGGLAGRSVQRTITAGAAARANEWLAVGASIRLSTLEVAEARAVWAGFSGREPVGSAGRDLTLDLEADTLARPGAAIGALAAPIDVPIEIAAGVSVDLPASLEGAAALRPTTDVGAPPVPGGRAAAAIKYPARIVAATGLRYLGERLVAEVNGEITASVGKRPRWTFTQISVTDSSGALGSLERVEPLLDVRRQYALRAAVDVAVVPGFLWATTGYAFTSAAASAAKRSPILAGPPVHRVAAGIEALWSGFTISLGYARELSPDVRVEMSDNGVAIINPFDAGSGAATVGRYRRSGDIGALQVETAW